MRQQRKSYLEPCRCIRQLQRWPGVEEKDAPFRLLPGTEAVAFADHVMQGRIEEYAKWEKSVVSQIFEM